MNEPKTADPMLVPGTRVWADRMKSLIDEIEHARSQGNWYVVEIRARELTIMCEMRRTK